MAYRYEWEPLGIHIKIFGATSGEEIDKAIDHIRQHPELPRLKYAIADYLEVEEFCVTPYDALLMAAHDHWASEVNAALKIALVGKRGEVVEAFRRYANSAVIIDTFAVRIFDDLDEARAWAAT